jgi:dTDP-4-amino-4,6-dideoxygalactose transaminase
VKLNHIDEWNEARKDRAALYMELLKDADVRLPAVKDTSDHVFHQFTLRVKDRDGLQKHLTEKGIASAIHYPVPLHLQPAFASEEFPEGTFPAAEKAAGEVISLPMYPELHEDEVQAIADIIIEFTG